MGQDGKLATSQGAATPRSDSQSQPPSSKPSSKVRRPPSSCSGTTTPLYKDYQRLLTGGAKPNLAKVTLARKLTLDQISEHQPVLAPPVQRHRRLCWRPFRPRFRRGYGWRHVARRRRTRRSAPERQAGHHRCRGRPPARLRHSTLLGCFVMDPRWRPATSRTLLYVTVTCRGAAR